MERVLYVSLVAWGVLVVAAMVVTYRRRRWELPRATTPEARQERRWQLLDEVYRITDGSTRRRVHTMRLQQRLCWSWSELEDLGAFLVEKGLVASDPSKSGSHEIGPSLRLTAAGVEAVEQASGQPDPVEYFTQITIHGDYSQVQVGTRDSQQQQIIDSLLLEHRNDIEAFLHGYQQAIDQLSDRDRLLAVDKLEAAEAQMYSAHPNNRVLHEALWSLRSIAEGVAGNAMFLALVELSKRFL
jgi:hypothetical protein